MSTSNNASRIGDRPVRLGMLSMAHLHGWSYADSISRMPGVEFVGIYHEDAAQGEQYAKQFNTRYFANAHDLLELVDGVVIASTNRRHEELVLAAVEKGKAALCEKPLAISAEAGARMVRAAREAGVPLFTAFPCRFIPSVERARQLIRSGRIGRVLAINGTNHGTMPGGWFTDPQESGGGALIDHTVHVVDLIRWFLDAEVTEVYAEYDRRLYDIPVEDCAILTFEIEGGIFATLDASWSRPRSFPFWGDVTMGIQGTAGIIRLDAFDQVITFYSDQRMRPTWQFFGENADYRMIAEFARVIREGGPTQLATGLDGLRAAEVAFAAYEAGRRHEPVRLQPVTV